MSMEGRNVSQVTFRTREGCGHGANAKALLEDLGFDYAGISLDHEVRAKAVGAIAGA